VKKLIILILFFVTHLVNSQVKKNFFVEDANGVDYVTVNFCVNNEAKIHKVKIIQEKTTYQNDSIIDGLRDYLLSIEYYQNSKLKNNCYDSTFSFINSEYEGIQQNKNDSIKKSPFLTGHYRYKNPIYSATIIKRGKHIQRENGIKDKQIYSIDWISNTKYKLVYKRMTEKRLKNLIGNEIIVEIMDILPDNSYVYKAESEQNKNATYGVIKKIK